MDINGLSTFWIVAVIVGLISLMFWVNAGRNWAYTAENTERCERLLKKVVALLEARGP